MSGDSNYTEGTGALNKVYRWEYPIQFIGATYFYTLMSNGASNELLSFSGVHNKTFCEYRLSAKIPGGLFFALGK